jgi:lysophospholipase L1-like esterase
VTGMVEAALAQGSRVVILSTTVIHEDLNNKENAKARDYNRALQEIASAHGCRFVNLYAAFEKAIRAYRAGAGSVSNLLTTDGVHMNDAGNQLMAHTLLKGLGIAEKSLEEAKEALRR